MRRAFKFRVYPTTGQASRAAQCLRDHQRLCNAALEERREAWRMPKVSIRYGQQSAQLKGIRGLDPDQRRWSFSSQQATLRRLDKAMAAFYRRSVAGQKPGYPRFKALDRRDPVEWPGDGDGCRWKPEMARGYLRGTGHVKVHVHRPVQGRVKTISLKREGRRWYVALSCDGVPAAPLAHAGRQIGLDVGVARFATTSDRRDHRQPEVRPRVRRRAGSGSAGARRKKRGSASRRRPKAKVAEVSRRIRDRRADFHHKTARALVRGCDVIALEDLRIANMTRSASGTPDAPGTSVPRKAA